MLLLWRVANCFDHQPPISRVDDYRALRLAREVYIKVPACNDCNTLAADFLTETILDRNDLVKHRIQKKNNRLLRSQVWSDKEIDKLGKNLRSYVRVQNEKVLRVLDRIDYCDGVQAYVDQFEI